MKEKNLSKKIYNEADRKGKRGYRLEYETNPDKTVTLSKLILIERNGAEAPIGIADVVTLIFGELDRQMAIYNTEQVAKKERVLVKKSK